MSIFRLRFRPPPRRLAAPTKVAALAETGASTENASAAFTGDGAYSKGTTGPFVILGWPITNVPELAKRPYGRIQIGGSDWPATDANRQAIADNGTTAKVAPLLYGYSASQATGTLDIDLDCAEDNDPSPNPTCTEQVAVAFSLTLAG